jgi:peptidoglycan/LPS O-acetylase OafA/YrhL
LMRVGPVWIAWEVVGAPLGRLKHAPALDGVRGLAVAAVVVFHSGASAWLPGGFLGVSLFFTLSGFLITSLILAEVDATGALALGPFWARRVRRLVPAMLVTLLGSLLLRTIIDLPARTGAEVIGGLTYSSNWLAIGQHVSYAELFTSPSVLTHLWSLAIEEQIYIAVPLMIWLVCRRHAAILRRLLVVGSVMAIVGSVVAALATSDHTAIYYGTHTRVGELAAGVLLAVVAPFGRRQASRRSTITGLAGLVAHVALWRFAAIGDGWLYVGGLTACSLASVAIIDAAMRPGVVARCLTNSTLCGLGRISYGLYLFHWPVTVVLSPTRLPIGAVGLFAVRVTVSVALAVVSSRFFESPIRRRSDARPGRLVGLSAIGLLGGATMIALVLGPSASVVAPSAKPPTVRLIQGKATAPAAPAASAAPSAPVVAVAAQAGRAAPVPPTEAAIAADLAIGLASTVGVIRSNFGANSDESSAALINTAVNSAEVAVDEPPVPTRVALFGDSVPNWLVRDGASALDLRSIELVDATIEGCDGAVGMPVGRSGSGVELPVLPNCPEWTGWYGKVLTDTADVAVLAVGPGVVVDRQLDGTWHGPCDVEFADWYRADIRARLTEMRSAAGRVVIVLPAWATDQSRWINPDDHIKRMGCVRDTLVQAVEQVDQATLTEGIANQPSEAEGNPPSLAREIRVVDLGAFLCPDGPGQCRDIRQADGVHIDPAAATEVLGWLLDQVTAP